jgi:hypothetical protein
MLHPLRGRVRLAYADRRDNQRKCPECEPVPDFVQAPDRVERVVSSAKGRDTMKRMIRKELLL